MLTFGKSRNVPVLVHTISGVGTFPWPVLETHVYPLSVVSDPSVFLSWERKHNHNTSNGRKPVRWRSEPRTLRDTLKSVRVSTLTIFKKKYTEKYIIVVCPGIRLENLRHRKITDDVEKAAAAKVQVMMETELIPYETSAKWVEDRQDDPDWLVIYAAKRKEDEKEYYDGFYVSYIQF